MYYYRVTAVNSKGLHSDPSNTAQANLLGQIQVRGPINQAASATPRFEWEPLPGAFAYDVQVFANYPDRFVDPIWEAGSLSRLRDVGQLYGSDAATRAHLLLGGSGPE